MAVVTCVMLLGSCSSATSDAGVTTTTAPPSSVDESNALGSWEEYTEQAERAHRAHRRCMEARGWEYQDEGDGYSIAIPEEQFEVHQTDDQECQEESGLADLGPPVVSAQEAQELYDIFLEVADCVRGLGMEVQEPPSRQAFVDSLVSYPIPIWHPHELDGEWRRELEERCPVPEWP